MCTEVCGRHPAECWNHCRSEYQSIVSRWNCLRIQDVLDFCNIMVVCPLTPGKGGIVANQADSNILRKTKFCTLVLLDYCNNLYWEHLHPLSHISTSSPDSWCHRHHQHFSCSGIQSSDTPGRPHPPAVPPSGHKFGVAGFQSVAGLSCLSQGFQESSRELKIQGMCCSALPGR